MQGDRGGQLVTCIKLTCVQWCTNVITLLLGSIPPGSCSGGFVPCGADADKPRRTQLAEALLAIPVLCCDCWQREMDSKVTPSWIDEHEATSSCTPQCSRVATWHLSA